MRAQARHCDSSLSSNWRDDTPQVVCTSKHDLLHNAHLFCLVLCYLLKGFLNSAKGPFRVFHVSSESVLKFFPVFIFTAVKPFFIIGSLQSVSWQHFTCSKYSLAGDSCCHWPWIPFLLQPALETSLLCFFLEENIPTSHVHMALFPSFSTSFRGTPSFPPPASTARLTTVFLHLPAGVC